MISQQRINELIDSLAIDHNVEKLLRQVEAEAYEAAARVCEANLKATPHHCAAAIRALKP